VTFLLLFVAAVINPPSPPQASCKPQLAPLNTGTSSAASKLPFWRTEEAGSWKGPGWIGWSHSASTLRPVRLNVEDLPKQQPDDDDEVTVESVPDVDYAIRCIPSVKPGPIAIGRRHTDNLPVLNESLTSPDTRRLGITLGDRKYEVRLESKEESLADARIVLSDGRQTQVLYSADGFADDPHFDIQWAGDLDRDGRLDLIVNLERKYSVHPIQLLLSSRAARGQLVGLAATFLTGD
jgi:hypothetical protein